MSEKSKLLDEAFRQFCAPFAGHPGAALRAAVLLCEWFMPGDGDRNPFLVKVVAINWNQICGGEPMPKLLWLALDQMLHAEINGEKFAHGSTMTKANELCRDVVCLEHLAKCEAAGIPLEDAKELIAYVLFRNWELSGKEAKKPPVAVRVYGRISELSDSYPGLRETLVDAYRNSESVWRVGFDEDLDEWRRLRVANPAIRDQHKKRRMHSKNR